MTVFSNYLGVISDVFVKLSQEKNIVEEIESIMGACAERRSPAWVCIPKKSLAMTRDFCNTTMLGWTLFRIDAHDRIFISFRVATAQALG